MSDNDPNMIDELQDLDFKDDSLLDDQTLTLEEQDIQNTRTESNKQAISDLQKIQFKL